MEKGNYLELLTSETTKILGSSTSKKTRDENSENVPHIEITEVVYFFVILLTMIINKIQECCIYTFAPNKSFGQLFDISPKKPF